MPMSGTKNSKVSKAPEPPSGDIPKMRSMNLCGPPPVISRYVPQPF
jgi:hypothetical protein